MNDDTVYDVRFPVTGGTIPADHAGLLYAALARVVPTFHADERVGIHPIRGEWAGERRLRLTGDSSLTLRLPLARVSEAATLIGRQLDLDGNPVRVGALTMQPLTPAPALFSRMVVVQGFLEPEGFLGAVQRQLAGLGIQGNAALAARRAGMSVEGQTVREAGTPLRRTLRIHDKSIVGFGVVIDELTAEESLLLQERGIGGRRRYGCGLFVPVRR